MANSESRSVLFSKSLDNFFEGIAEFSQFTVNVFELLYDSLLGESLHHTMNKLKETSDQLNNASRQLSETIQHANSGKGALNMLLTDTAFSANIQQSMLNIKIASIKLDQDMDALKHNFLTRSYFRKQAKKASSK